MTATLEVQLPDTLEPGDQFVRRVFLDALRPEPRLSLAEWGDKHRRLSRASSAEPGRYEIDRGPYLREIAHSLTECPEIEWVVWQKGSQIFATELACNLIGWVIDQDPSGALLVESSSDVAKRVAKTRLEPMFRDTPRLRSKVTSRRVAKDEVSSSLIEKSFPGGLLVCAGANSPNNFRSFSYRIGIGDEVDAWPVNVGSEGDPVLLLERGAKTYHDRKFFLLSTPTIEGISIIHREFLRGDQRYFLVPCPLCGHYQRLYWTNKEGRRGLVMERRHDPDSVKYCCEKCDQLFGEHHKTEFLAAGRWEPSATPDDPKIRSYHLASFYSPLGQYSWRDIAAKFLRANKSGPTALQVFVNHECAEPWRVQGEVPDWEQLYAQREAYRKGTVPKGGLLLTAGADVQEDRIEVQTIAWGRGKESWSVDYSVFAGDTSTAAPWDELAKFLDRPYRHELGHWMSIRALAVDCAFRTSVAVEWGRGRHRVYTTWGDTTGRQQTIVAPPKAVEVTKKGKRRVKGARIWRVGTGVAKEEIYGHLRLKPPTGESAPYPPGFHHTTQDYTDEHFKQLTAEVFGTRKDKRGFVVRDWIKIRDRNEVLDTFVYARAAAAIAQVDRFTEADWSRLEHEAADQRAEAERRNRNDQSDSDAEVVREPPPPPPPSAPKRSRRSFGLLDGHSLEL